MGPRRCLPVSWRLRRSIPGPCSFYGSPTRECEHRRPANPNEQGVPSELADAIQGERERRLRGIAREHGRSVFAGNDQFSRRKPTCRRPTLTSRTPVSRHSAWLAKRATRRTRRPPNRCCGAWRSGSAPAITPARAYRSLPGPRGVSFHGLHGSDGYLLQDGNVAERRLPPMATSSWIPSSRTAATLSRISMNCRKSQQRSVP